MADTPLRGVLQHIAGIAGAQTLAEATDGELLARFAGQHDQTAFAVLLRRHGPMVRNVSLRLLRQSEDAEDVFQAAFLLLARKAAGIRKPGSVGSWLYGVVYHLASKARARRGRRQFHEWRAAQMHQADAGVKAAWREVQAALDESLERLPEKYRAVLVLCYLEAKSHEEAARQLSCPLATLRSRLARGREKLRAALARRGLTLSAGGLIALLTANAADAALPPTLLQSTLQAAPRFLAGEPVASVVSVTVAHLVEGGLKTMLVSKVKIVMVVVVALGLFTAGVGFAAFQALVVPPPAARQDSSGGKAAEREAAPKSEGGKPAKRAAPPSSRELVVRVTDSDGKPLTDAEVYFLADYHVRAKGRTDAEGRWTGRVSDDTKDWAVFARKAKVGFDYATARPSRRARDEPRLLPNQLALTLDGARTVRVKTVDRQGKPIAGVKVGPWYIQKPGRENDINLGGTSDLWPPTDKEGVVVLDWLPQRFEYSVPILTLSNAYYNIDHGTPLMADKPTEELTLTLLPMERISGRVTHADGRPAVGIVVSAQGQGAGINPSRPSARTDADGRYTMKACSEQAYILAIKDDQWAAPYRAGTLVRAGKPVEGVDFVLGRATRLHGRVTLGKDGRPPKATYISVVIDKGQIPEELRRKDDRAYHAVRMDLGTQTDKDGRFEFHLGAGDYQLQGPPRTEPVKITIPKENPPLEIMRDFRMPRPETGPLAGRVLDAEGQPIAGAVVDGRYAASIGRWFPSEKTDTQGRFQTERSLDPLVLHARTADKTRAGLTRISAEASGATVLVGPVARASGRLFDLQGKPLAQKKLDYGIRIHLGANGWSDCFGGRAVTDATGHFTLTGLIPGETYYVMLPLNEYSFGRVTEVKPNGPKALDLGDLRVDPEPPRPYVPPTPAKRTADAFTANPKKSPRQRMETLLAEARREYTRPLLLLGQPKDPACVELFRLFHEEPEQADAKNKAAGERRPPAPSELRWEFELASLDTDRLEVRQFAQKLGVAVGKDRPPVLVVLDAGGAVAATHPLALGDKHKLDSPALAAFLLKHKLATRDAERMLAEALRKAKSEDKRTFFIASASWCQPCRLLSRFLAAHKSELERHYVFVKLDISRDKHADTVRNRFQGGKHEGVPWYAILDTESKVLTTSNVPKAEPGSRSTNMGFPSEAAEIEHFVTMLKQTAPRLSVEQLNELRTALTKKK